MKLKLNQILVAALVAAAAVPAMASIKLGNTGDGELFLVVWDEGDKVSYVKDLGVTLNAFNGSAGLSYALSDANFAGFLGVANTTPTDIKFAVIGSDSVGQKRIFTTVDSVDTPYNNGNLTSGTGYLNAFANNQVTVSAHTTHAGPASVNGTSYDVAPNFAYFGTQNGSTFLNSIQGTWTNSVLVGTAAVFRSFASFGSGTGGGDPTIKTDFAGVWNVTQSNGAWTAAYSVAAVPEADGLVMALAGFGAVGFLSLRRRQD